MTPASRTAARAGLTIIDQLRWLVSWWGVVQFGAVLMVLALSPSSYRDPRTRAALARHAWMDTAPILLGFSILCSLLTVVITRIVVVTAESYGLSAYALEMVIRVLVLELIPLIAALFVAVRSALPAGGEITTMRRRGELDAQARAGRDPLQHELLPRALASLFLVALLATAAGLVALVLAYLVAYGFSPWGLPSYTRTVGSVMSPPVALVFLLKTALFAAAVAVLPLVSAMADAPVRRTRSGAELRGLLRMLAVMVLIELGSLTVNYI